jgi:hypothetical protein
MNRWLRERDSSRDSGDKLARCLLDHIERQPDPDLAKALVDYQVNDGPCWALPPGEWMITRYDWSKHVTVPVQVFADKPSAEVELERRKQIKTDKPQHLAIVRRAG